MKLDVLERLVILAILPKENDITTMKVVGNLREELGFSEEEHKLLDFKRLDDGRTIWREKDDDGNPIELERDFTIGVKGAEIIAERLKELDGEKKISLEMLSLYQKFVDADLRVVPKLKPKAVKKS